MSVFVHGIKNQLLASRVAQKKLNRALAGESPNLEEVRRSAALLWELNEGMLARMDELYRTVKASALSLRPIHLDMIAASAVKRFHGKYPDAKVEVELGTNRLVLADYGPLGEALYNLLINGYEAAVLAGRTPEVKIITRPWWKFGTMAVVFRQSCKARSMTRFLPVKTPITIGAWAFITCVRS